MTRPFTQDDNQSICSCSSCEGSYVGSCTDSCSCFGGGDHLLEPLPDEDEADQGSGAASSDTGTVVDASERESVHLSSGGFDDNDKIKNCTI